MKINLLFILFLFSLIIACKEEEGPPILDFEGRVVLAGTNRSPLGKPLTVYLIRKEREKGGLFYPIDSLKTDSNGYFKKSFIVDRQFSEYKLSCEKLSGYDELTQLVPSNYGLNTGEILVRGYASVKFFAHNIKSTKNDTVYVEVLPYEEPLTWFYLEPNEKAQVARELLPANEVLIFKIHRYGFLPDSIWYYERNFQEDREYELLIEY